MYRRLCPFAGEKNEYDKPPWQDTGIEVRNHSGLAPSQGVSHYSKKSSLTQQLAQNLVFHQEYYYGWF